VKVKIDIVGAKPIALMAWKKLCLESSPAGTGGYDGLSVRQTSVIVSARSILNFFSKQAKTYDYMTDRKNAQ